MGRKVLTVYTTRDLIYRYNRIDQRYMNQGYFKENLTPKQRRRNRKQKISIAHGCSRKMNRKHGGESLD